ncbi:hypothetical protein KM043_005817 [Ampulex compressa]|nr:hypothetical protein KM043_005817 [Ampulex compressa]
MEKESQFDPEFHWLYRTCTNGFNVYLAMIHYTFYDNTVSSQPDAPFSEALTYALFMAALDFLVYCILQ